MQVPPKAYQTEVPFVGEDIQQLDQVGAFQLPQQLDFSQCGNIHALQRGRCSVLRHLIGLKALDRGLHGQYEHASIQNVFPSISPLFQGPTVQLLW